MSRRRNGLFVDRIVGASRTAATGGRTRLAVLYGVAERERRALAAQVARRRDSVREHDLRTRPQLRHVRRRRERWLIVQNSGQTPCTRGHRSARHHARHDGGVDSVERIEDKQRVQIVRQPASATSPHNAAASDGDAQAEFKVRHARIAQPSPEPRRAQEAAVVGHAVVGRTGRARRRRQAGTSAGRGGAIGGAVSHRTEA